MEERLFKAAIDGNVHKLKELIEDDNQIPHKILVGYYRTNPLHLAISKNQVDFVKELLGRNEDLAEVLDSGRSPLHLAAAKGNLEIVKALVIASRDMCLARDPDGRNPIHVAAMKGKVEVMKELVEASPNAARVKLDRNETFLHLCVRHGQLNSLELLLKMDIGFEFVNAKDTCGNTILHLAVSSLNSDAKPAIVSTSLCLIIKCIVNYNNHDVGVHGKRKKFELNATNAEGHTALDIVLLSQNKNYEKILVQAKCKRTKDLVQRDWLSKKRDTLMVVASLIATMAFQAAVSPPAGVWQEDTEKHRAGEAVMAYNYPDSYPYFLRANTTAFVASLSMILLLISDVPFKNRLYMWVLVVIMWLTITSTAITYGFSITVVTPKKDRGPLSDTVTVGVTVWCSVMALLLVYHTYKLIKDVWDEYKCKMVSSKNDNVSGNGDRDQTTNKSAQSKQSYAYTMAPNLPTRNGNGSQQQECQLV